MLTADTLKALGVGPTEIARHLDTLNALLPRYGIDTPLRVAHFLAQVLHESGRLRLTAENMNYSAKRLREVFGKYFRTADPRAYAHRPARIGARVYANRMGNGDEASGDGWRYRGRGLIQLTGRTNYAAFSGWLGEDVTATPDRVATDFAAHSAVYYWDAHKLNALADRDDVIGITKRINGGLNGLADRQLLLAQAKRHLGVGVRAKKKPQEASA